MMQPDPAYVHVVREMAKPQVEGQTVFANDLILTATV